MLSNLIWDVRVLGYKYSGISILLVLQSFWFLLVISTWAELHQGLGAQAPPVFSSVFKKFKLFNVQAIFSKISRNFICANTF